MTDPQHPPRPRIVITEMDFGPEELRARLPIEAELVRPIPGSDGMYALAVVRGEAVPHRTTLDALRSTGIDPAKADPGRFDVAADGTVDIGAFGLVLKPRIVGDSIHLSMN